MSRLNKTFIDKVEAPHAAPGKQAQAFYRDSALPGFGLRVTNTGVKSFIVEKRIKGKVKRITIGRYGPLTPEKARIKAIEVLGDITVGRDPIAEKKAQHARGVTLGEAFDSYLAARHDLKPGTIKNYRKCIDGALADWKTKPLTELDKTMVQQRHAKIGKTAPARANNVMRVLRAIFNHAMEQYEDDQGQPIIQVNPTKRISHTRSWYRIERRTSVLKPHQLKAWFEATVQLQQTTTRDYLQLLLFTGLRKTEAATLTWDNIDLQHRTLTVPDTKNREPHTLPLPEFLHELLQRRYEVRESDWVFPSPRNDGPLTEPRNAVKRVAELSGITFMMHDLRRTFITVAESLDISAYAMKRLVNHRMPNDVTAGYIISDVERLRIPMQDIASFLTKQIEAGTPEETVPSTGQPGENA
ncbi:MAG: integrase [Gammaproteobacteria bacterium]|nr:MAG: integrase [Gammaproteobacteria bacterium]